MRLTKMIPGLLTFAALLVSCTPQRMGIETMELTPQFPCAGDEVNVRIVGPDAPGAIVKWTVYPGDSTMPASSTPVISQGTVTEPNPLQEVTFSFRLDTSVVKSPTGHYILSVSTQNVDGTVSHMNESFDSCEAIASASPAPLSSPSANPSGSLPPPTSPTPPSSKKIRTVGWLVQAAVDG